VVESDYGEIVAHKSKVALAIHYALQRWAALMLFCKDGRVETTTTPLNAPSTRSTAI
jgi:hypothetical protein